MKLIPLNSIFDIQYGNQLDLYKLDSDDKSEINFVSRTSQNLGVVAKVSRLDDIEPFPVGLITVTLGGTYLLSSFIQEQPFYTAQNIKVLTPKYEMTYNEKLFYCKAIEMNRFRYTSHGREANETLDFLMVPEKVPSNFRNINIDEILKIDDNAIIKQKIILYTNNWSYFSFDYLFDVIKGQRLTKADIEEGNTFFIGSSDSNNGVTAKISNAPIFKDNTITVNYDGSVAEAFYQPTPYWALDSVNVLYPKFPLNVYIALFLTTIIRLEKYRFNYGRKWKSELMKKSKIKLPTKNRQPDFEFMENYIKSLPYSSSI